MKTATVSRFGLESTTPGQRNENSARHWARLYPAGQPRPVPSIVRERDDTSLRKARMRHTAHDTELRAWYRSPRREGRREERTRWRDNAAKCNIAVAVGGQLGPRCKCTISATRTCLTSERSRPYGANRMHTPKMHALVARRRRGRRWAAADRWNGRERMRASTCVRNRRDPRGPTSTAREHPTDYSRTWSVSRTLRSLLLGGSFLLADRYAATARFLGLSPSRARSPPPSLSRSLLTPSRPAAFRYHSLPFLSR